MFLVADCLLVQFNTLATLMIRDLQADTKLLSNAEDALPYEKPFYELSHFRGAIDWVSYQKHIIANRPDVATNFKFTASHAFSIIFERFVRYWLARVKGGECQL